MSRVAHPDHVPPLTRIREAPAHVMRAGFVWASHEEHLEPLRGLPAQPPDGRAVRGG